MTSTLGEYPASYDSIWSFANGVSPTMLASYAIYGVVKNLNHAISSVGD